jgi:hypothetical protein
MKSFFVLAFTSTIIISGCKKDISINDEDIKSIVGSWLVSGSISDNGKTFEAREMLTLTQNTYIDKIQIKDPISFEWLDLNAMKGKVSIKKDSIKFELEQIGTSSKDLISGLPSGNIDYIQYNQFIFENILKIKGLNKYINSVFIVSRNKLILKTDNNRDGDVNEDGETITYFKQLDTKTMLLFPPRLILGYKKDSDCFYIVNTGTNELNWNIETKSFIISKKNGMLNAGDSIKIWIKILGGDNSNKSYQYIKITCASGEKDSVLAIYDPSWLLDLNNIIDAEFCKKTNKIITITSNPNELSIIDPENKFVNSISLNKIPTCVSVHQDGNIVVIGHNGSITYIDLIQQKIEKEYNISCNAYDIAISNTFNSYITPSEGQHSRIRCIDYLTGNETLDIHSKNYFGIYEKSIVKYQPNSSSIFVSETNVTSGRIVRFQINGITAVNYTFSDVNIDYYYFNDFWFSEDGKMIFSIYQNIAYIPNIDSDTILKLGNFINTKSAIFKGDHCLANNTFYELTYSSLSEVNAYSTINFELISKYKILPIITYNVTSFNHDGTKMGFGCYSDEGLYVFSNKEGSCLYVVVQAKHANDLSNKLAIQRIEIH